MHTREIELRITPVGVSDFVVELNELPPGVAQRYDIFRLRGGDDADGCDDGDGCGFDPPCEMESVEYTEVEIDQDGALVLGVDGNTLYVDENIGPHGGFYTKDSGFSTGDRVAFDQTKVELQSVLEEEFTELQVTLPPPT